MLDKLPWKCVMIQVRICLQSSGKPPSDVSSSLFDQDPFEAAAMKLPSPLYSRSPRKSRKGSSHQRQPQTTASAPANMFPEDGNSSFVADRTTSAQDAFLPGRRRTSGSSQSPTANNSFVSIKQRSDGSYHRQTPQQQETVIPNPKRVAAAEQAMHASSAATKRRVRQQMKSSSSRSSNGEAVSTASFTALLSL